MIAAKSCTVWLAAAMLCLCATSGARADAIDDNWCSKDGRTMIIRGDRITLPGGSEIKGSYSRHSYAYQVPENHDRAGSVVTMVLVDENTIHLTPGGSSSVPLKSAVETWKRCAFTT